MTTLRDKVGQLFMLGFDGPTVSKDMVKLIDDYRPGGFIVFKRNLESANQIVKLTNKLQKHA
ncbi:MAG: beta-N-acetylhexosaminidase, partial [Nitrospirales bacterium]|nr:beta-N-acetylhexosaminidase [Nitrospirales bacterium]